MTATVTETPVREDAVPVGVGYACACGALPVIRKGRVIVPHQTWCTTRRYRKQHQTVQDGASS